MPNSKAARCVTNRDLRLLGCTHTKFLKINGIIGTGIRL